MTPSHRTRHEQIDSTESPESPVLEPDQPPTARMESFDVVRPDGVLVRVTRNIDTGEQSIVVLEEAGDA